MFFDYRQNNSGGSFHVDQKAGISVNVIVEADDAKEADYRAERIGLYFDGAGDCSCCGDRWYAQGDSWQDAKGDPVPSLYGEPIVVGGPFIDEGMSWKWIKDAPEGYVHYKDGRVEPFGLDVAKVRPPKVLNLKSSGSKTYGTCSDCETKAQVNKKGEGSLHVCV